MKNWGLPRHFELGERTHFAHVRISVKNDHSERSCEKINHLSS